VIGARLSPGVLLYVPGFEGATMSRRVGDSSELETGGGSMRNYLAVPILVGAAFAVLYGVFGILLSILDAIGWVEELRFHILGIHFEGFALVVVSVALIVLAVAGMLYLTGAKEELA
jgi:hypothetical protein